MKNLMLVICTVVGFSVSGWAQQTCGVPVCDIPAALQQLSTMGQSDRAQTVKDLRVKYRGEKDVAIFANLKDFSDQAKDLFVSLKEEDWVIREAIYLQNVARVGLIKYAPVDQKELIQNFDVLTDEGSIFDVLNYWTLNVEQLEVVKDVLAIVSFAEHAKSWAIQTKQEAYISREADKIIFLGGTHVSRLNPVHEGSFSISMSCEPRPQDCGAAALKLKQLSIMDTLSARGLVVSLSDVDMYTSFYVYSTSELTKNGTHIHGISTEATPWTRVSEVNIDVDPATGVVTGTLKDIEYAGTLHFTGKPIKRVSEFYTDSVGPARTIDKSQILGRYQGHFGPYKNATLVVSQYTSGELVGAISLGEGEQTLGFRNGTYHTKRGVLSLTAAGSSNTGDRKIVLGLRKDKKGRELLTGFMFLNTPQIVDIEFYRTADQ